MKYALVENNEIVRTDGKPYPPYDTDPRWRQVIDNPPAYDPGTQWLTQNPMSEWVINTDSVEVTYTVTDKTAAEILEYQRAQVTLGVLAVDTHTIPADSTTVATVTYTSKDPVTFIVDGEAIEKIPNDVYTATLTVAADAPGHIEVRIPGVERVVTITVTEVEA